MGMTSYTFLTSLKELIPTFLDFSGTTVAAYASKLKVNLLLFKAFWSLVPLAGLRAGSIPSVSSIFAEFQAALFSSFQAQALTLRDIALPPPTDAQGVPISDDTLWDLFTHNVMKRVNELSHMRLTAKAPAPHSAVAIAVPTAQPAPVAAQTSRGPQSRPSQFLRLETPTTTSQTSVPTIPAHAVTPVHAVPPPSPDSEKKYSTRDLRELMLLAKRQHSQSPPPTPTAVHAVTTHDTGRTYSEYELRELLAAVQATKRQRLSTPTPQLGPCYDYLKGHCTRNPCKFSHTPVPPNICRNSIVGRPCHNYPCRFDHTQGQVSPATPSPTVPPPSVPYTPTNNQQRFAQTPPVRPPYPSFGRPQQPHIKGHPTRLQFHTHGNPSINFVAPETPDTLEYDEHDIFAPEFPLPADPEAPQQAQWDADPQAQEGEYFAPW